MFCYVLSLGNNACYFFDDCYIRVYYIPACLPTFLGRGDVKSERRSAGAHFAPSRRQRRRDPTKLYDGKLAHSLLARQATRELVAVHADFGLDADGSTVG